MKHGKWHTILESKVYGSIGLRCAIQRLARAGRYRIERIVLFDGENKYVVNEFKTPLEEWMVPYRYACEDDAVVTRRFQQQFFERLGGDGEDEVFRLFQDIANGLQKTVQLNGTTIDIQSLYR